MVLDLDTLARALGLVPHEPLVGYAEDLAFGRLTRCLGPAMPAAVAGSWLSGVHGDVSVFVIPHRHDGGLGWEPRTAFVAPIEPPLFLGLDLHERSLLRDRLGRNDVRIGFPGFDSSVHASADDAARLTWFLAPWRRDSFELLSTIARAVKQGLRVTDSTVTIFRPMLPDPRDARESLALATWIARVLSHRSHASTPTPDEQARAHRWHELARRRGLAFDPRRMCITGEIEGDLVEIVLEPMPAAPVTAFTMTLAGAPSELHVRKRGYRAPWGVVEPPVTVLDEDGRSAALDDALRDALARLAGASRELRIDGETLAWVTGACAYESEIEAALTTGIAVARAMPRLGQRPYR